MRRVFIGMLIAAVLAAALATLILANGLWGSRALVWLVWLTSAPVMLLAELGGHRLQHFGFFLAPPSQWDIVRFAVFFVASFLWISLVFCPVLYGVRVFGTSLRLSQILTLLFGSAISATCFQLFHAILLGQ